MKKNLSINLISFLIGVAFTLLVLYLTSCSSKEDDYVSIPAPQYYEQSDAEKVPGTGNDTIIYVYPCNQYSHRQDVIQYTRINEKAPWKMETFVRPCTP